MLVFYELLIFLCYSEFLFLTLQRIVAVRCFARHIDKTKRYALLAQMKPEKFQFVAQEFDFPHQSH